MTDKIYLITQCAVHLINLVVSFYILVPVATHMSDFRGHCALFSCGSYITDDGSFDPQWSSCAYCVFSIIVGFFTFFSSLSQILLKIRLLYKILDSSFLEAFVDFFLDCIVVALVFINSIIITLGSYKWCHCVMQRFSSCDVAASVIEIRSNNTINSTNFAFHLDIIQFGTWSLLVSSVFQLMFSARKVFLYHERENLIASMARERLRYQQQ